VRISLFIGKLLRIFNLTFTIFCLFVYFFHFVVEAGNTSSIEAETIRETSISTLSSEHQQLYVKAASRITNLTSESDSQNLDNNDEGIFETCSVVNLA
jgi:hypothetical protein